MLQTLRHAVRSLLRTPTFSAVSVLTLSLGIAGSTSTYALLERVILNPLPYPAADRLIRLKSQVPGVAPGTEWDLSAGEFFHFSRQSQTFETISAYRRTTATIQAPTGPARVRVVFASSSALRLFGGRTIHGRLIESADDRPGAPMVAMLSHAMWQRQFGAEPTAIGRSLQVFGQAVEIVGVMAPGVEPPDDPGVIAGIQTDVWVPMRLDANGPFYNEHTIPMIARLKPGVTLEQTQNELDRLTAQLPEAVPSAYSASFFERYGFRTAAYPLREHTVGEVARNLWLLFGAVGLVLLAACANIANLFLVRLEGRRRELGIRTTMGASRWAIGTAFLCGGLARRNARRRSGCIPKFWGNSDPCIPGPSHRPAAWRRGVGRKHRGFQFCNCPRGSCSIDPVPDASLSTSPGGRGLTGRGAVHYNRPREPANSVGAHCQSSGAGTHVDRWSGTTSRQRSSTSCCGDGDPV